MATVQAAPEMKLGSALPVSQEKTDIDYLALALSFINPWSVEPKWEEPAETETNPKERVITLAEVSEHDSWDDCWVVIYDRVYDITNFFDEHPGGSDIMFEYAGQDASMAFRGSGHSRMAVKALDRFLVGELPMNERMYRRPGGIRLSDIPE